MPHRIRQVVDVGGCVMKGSLDSPLSVLEPEPHLWGPISYFMGL